MVIETYFLLSHIRILGLLDKSVHSHTELDYTFSLLSPEWYNASVRDAVFGVAFSIYIWSVNFQ